MNCPKCGTLIPIDQINIQTDRAQCVTCGNIFKVSNTESDVNINFDFNDIPDGAWYLNNYEKTTIGATTRSRAAFFLVPFMLVWSGFSLGGIYGPQILSGHFNIFMSLFGIPFFLGSLLFWSIAFMSIWGKIELTFDNQTGRIFTGIGKIGINKNFEWKDITSISGGESAKVDNTSQGKQIVFEGNKRISFGLGLTEARKYYILRALQKIHAKRNNSSSFQPYNSTSA